MSENTINEKKFVDINILGAQIKAELIFMELMKHPPEIRAILYKKIMGEDNAN